jgi:hypothetical protein
MVGVHFDVLVRDAFLFERDPDPLHEGAEPAGVQFEIILCRMRLSASVHWIKSWNTYAHLYCFSC